MSQAHPPPRLFVAELFGLPGSGKTTLVRHVTARNEGIRGISGYRRPENALPYVPAALEISPIALRSYLRGRGSWPQTNTLARIRMSFLIARREARAGTKALVFDQGPLFLLDRLASDVDRYPDGPRLERWRERALRNWAEVLDAIVVLEAPIDVLIERIRERPKNHRFKPVPNETLLQFLEAQRKRFEATLIDVAELDRSPPVIRIDTGNVSVAACAARLHEAVRVASST
jgi:cytidylate kinase